MPASGLIQPIIPRTAECDEGQKLRSLWAESSAIASFALGRATWSGHVLAIVRGLFVGVLVLAVDQAAAAGGGTTLTYVPGSSRGDAAWKNAGIPYNTCSRISRNLKEFRSGAIRVDRHEPGAP
jgi:hypothetical protein